MASLAHLLETLEPGGTAWRTTLNFNITQLDPGRITGRGALVNRPVVQVADRFYYSDDTRQLWFDTGTQWDEVSETLLMTLNIAGNYNFKVEDNVILVDASGGNVTLDISPSASLLKGNIIVVKKIDASAFTVTIDPNGAETIDGVTTKLLSNQYQSITFISDGTDYHVFSTDDPTILTNPLVGGTGHTFFKVQDTSPDSIAGFHAQNDAQEWSIGTRANDSISIVDETTGPTTRLEIVPSGQAKFLNGNVLIQDDSGATELIIEDTSVSSVAALRMKNDGQEWSIGTRGDDFFTIEDETGSLVPVLISSGVEFRLDEIDSVIRREAGTAKLIFLDADDDDTFELKHIQASDTLVIGSNSLDPTVTIAKAGLVTFAGDVNVEGILNHYQYEEDLVEDSTTSTAPQQMLRLTTPSLPAGTYRIEADANVRTSDSGERVYVQVEVDDTTVILQWVRTIDDVNDSDVREPVGGFVDVVLTAAVHTIDLDWRSGTAGKTAFIRDGKIAIRRVG